MDDDIVDPLTLPGWDGSIPLDVFKWQRQRAFKRWQTSQLPMMRATDAEGNPLYQMTDSGNWRRTKALSSSRRKRVLERDGYACIWCGATEPLEVDHIVRYVDGGSNEMDNLRTLCLPCHQSRGGRA